MYNGPVTTAPLFNVEIPCAIPIPPLGGNIIFTPPELEDDVVSVIYSCNHGFKLKGQSVQSCLASGFWTSTPPMCLGIHTKLFN